MIICSIVVCTYQIHLLYIKWQSNPVIVTLDTESTAIFKIPFPAVTICPQSKSDRSKFKLTELFQKSNFSTKERRSLYALAHVCKYEYEVLVDLEFPVENSSNMDKSSRFINLRSIFDDLKNIN